LSFANNHPPSGGTVTLYRSGPVMAIPVASLTNSWSDPDGDPVVLAGVNFSSTNGTGNVSTDGTLIYYTNASAVADQIFYTVQDVRTNPPAVYRPGDTVRTATGNIVILPPPAIGSVFIQGTNLVLSGANGAPDGSYYVLSSTNLALPLSQWRNVATDSFDGLGNFSFTNAAASEVGQAYYRLKLP
jgi:hypothetical protein